MTKTAHSAVVLCPEEAEPSRRVLGLSVGERLLLTLEHSGVTEVCFVGSGQHPTSSRSKLHIIERGELDPERSYFLLASDTVFDRNLLTLPVLPSDIAMLCQGGLILQESLNDLAGTLAALGQGQALSGKGFALRVDSCTSVTQAERALLLSMRKPIDGFISTHLNRHVSLFCTRYLVKTGLPPNFFTVIFMAIGLAGAVFATQAEYAWALVLAGLCFQGQSILDGCDGEMARLTYRFSRRGQWLDSIGDDLTNYSVCFGLAIGQARVLDEPRLYWLGAGVLVLQLFASGVLYRRMLLMGTGDLLAIPDLVRTERPEGLRGLVSDAISLILKRDTFIFLLAALIIFQQPLVAFYAYAIGTLPMFLGVLLNDYRISRQNAVTRERTRA